MQLMSNVRLDMLRRSLRFLIFIAAAAKSVMQIIGYARLPEAVVATLPLIFYTSLVMAALQLYGSFLALKKPFESFLALALVWLLHIILFPVAALIAGPERIGPYFWSGFLISSVSNIVLAALAYLSWWLSDRHSKA
jgi:hypothetical protein